MAPYTPVITFVLGLLVAGTLGALVALAQERNFKNTVAAYARIIETDDKRFANVMDRLHASRNLPPENVDMAVERAEQRERAKTRSQEKSIYPKRVGPNDSTLLAMELDVRRQRAEAAS